jgi:hypothetical protein
MGDKVKPEIKVINKLYVGNITIQWVLGAVSLWVKRPEREADHSPPSSGEVKE